MISGILVFEITKKRAFLMTQELFPKKENDPVIYWLSVVAKVIVLIIVIIRTIQEYVVA